MALVWEVHVFQYMYQDSHLHTFIVLQYKIVAKSHREVDTYETANLLYLFIDFKGEVYTYSIGIC